LREELPLEEGGGPLGGGPLGAEKLGRELMEGADAAGGAEGAEKERGAE
jgi:hypothetical protein